jgi:hypothetical protein
VNVLPTLQDEDLLAQYYPYLRGGEDIYSCTDEHKVQRSCPSMHYRGAAHAALPACNQCSLRPPRLCQIPWLPGASTAARSASATCSAARA